MLNSVARLSADDRRRQLVGIGLRMLTTRPIHELSVDAVAADAGISRGLLFHYFPTKRDFYVAVMRAASRRLLRQTLPDAALPAGEQLRAMLTAYISFVARRRASYISFVRGAAGGDDFVVEVYDETRAALTTRVLDMLGSPTEANGSALALAPAPVDRMIVHGWIAYVEDLAIEWSSEPSPSLPADHLVEHAVAALEALRRLPLHHLPNTRKDPRPTARKS